MWAADQNLRLTYWGLDAPVFLNFAPYLSAVLFGVRRPIVGSDS